MAQEYEKESGRWRHLCTFWYACASVNNNNVQSEDLKMNESLFYGGKCLFL